MAASIWNLRPLERTPQSKRFTDPEQPEWEGVTLTLAPLDGLRATKYAVLKAELMKRHVTGVKDADGKVLEEPEAVRCQDFSRRTPDEVVIDRYAKMAAMWAADAESNPLPPLSEMLGWQALLYAGWLDIANFIEDIYAAGLEPDSGTLGNRPGPHTAASSEPSASTTESTPKLPPGETPSSARSNAESGLLPDGSYRWTMPAEMPAGVLPD